MTDSGDASDLGLSSHGTSASPPPAKRTRLNLKAKTPTPSVSASPPANRVQTRRSAALASSASTSVAGDAQVSTPLIIPDVDTTSLARDSRASSQMSTFAPNTRSKKRKADQLESESPSVNGEAATPASAVQDVIANHDAADESHVARDTPDGINLEDQDHNEDEEQEQDQEPQVVSTKRGRPPGKGKGKGVAKAGGKGKGKGKAKAKAKAKGKGKGRSGPSRQDSGAPEAVKRPAGRGGRGKKTSANYIVQIAYDRQADLRQSYKEVARVVRVGLEILAEKSLDVIRDDPIYHQEVFEFDEVINDLDAKHNAVVGQHGALYNKRLEHARKKREMDNEYARIEFQCKIQDLKDKYELRCKAAFLETIRRSKPVVDPSASVAPEEQVNFRLLSEERTDIFGGEIATGDRVENSTEPVRRPKRGSPKKRPAKEAPSEEPVAKRPSLLSAAAPPAEESDDDQVPDEARPAPILESPLESQGTGKSTQTPDRHSKNINDDDQPVISFPRYVRRGRQPEPNNRAILKPFFTFDKDEIGFRNIYAEADKQPPQLKNFHLDVLSYSSGTGYNLADHKIGDFDMKLVKRHKLDPRYGIAIPGCINPDNVEPPTDFTKPVARTTPVTFVSKDGRTIIETSRSAALVHTEQDWAQFEKLLDMKRAVGKFDPRDLLTAKGFATYDAVAREVDECKQGAEALLQAASDLEHIHAYAQPTKRRKISSNSTPAATAQVLGSFDDVQEIEREAFMRRSDPPQGIPDGLQTLADMAAIVARETARRSPAPAQFVHSTSAQSGTSFRSNYSPPKRNHSQAFGQLQGPAQKTKYLQAPTQASPQTMAASTTRPLPKRREPPLPVDSTAPQPVAPELTAPQSVGPQLIGSQSFAAQPMAPPARGPQPLAPSGRAPPSMAPPIRFSQSMASPRTPQSMGPLTRAPQAVALQPAASQSRAPQPVAAQLSAHHPTAPQLASLNSMAPPAIPNQATGSQNMASQLASPRTMGPPPPPPAVAPQGMGPPPNLPDPSQSTFTRPRNMTGAQNVLPMPTPSQIPSPKIHSPQHLTQAQPYFQGAQRQQQGQQQHMQQQQPQQQSAAATSRSGRIAPPLPTLAPRPDRGRSHGRQVPHQHQHHYDNVAPLPPFQGPNGAPPMDRAYGYSSRESYGQQQAQQQAQQQPHPQAQQQTYTQAQPQPYPQAHPQPYTQAHSQAQPQAQPQTQAQQFQPQQQQAHPPAQVQQYHPQMQQRQPQSPVQHFQHPTQQRQTQPPAQQFQQQRQTQSPAQSFQQTPQQRQTHSPTQSFQRPAQPPQSPTAQFQQPEQQQRQPRKSFGGGDGIEEREPYPQSSGSQFRPINKQYPPQPQPQQFQQHRSPYANPQRPSQQPGQQPGQQPPNQQQQQQFGSLPPPPPPPPPPGRQGMGSYGGYPDP